MNSKKLVKALVNTFSHEVGTALLSMNHALEKMNKVDCVTKNNLVIIKNSHNRIKRTLAKISQLASSDFRNIRIKSDRLGLCSYIDLDNIDIDTQQSFLKKSGVVKNKD